MKNGDKNNLTREEILNKVALSHVMRRAVTRKSHFLFFHIFFNHHIGYETALFQREMLQLSEDEHNKFLVIMAFRGSGKSTILTLSYPLWAILGIQQKKFVVIISKDQRQTKDHFSNLKHELETNKRLRADLGPFKTDNDNWGSCALELPYMNARIVTVSRGQSVRGIRFRSHRPDLIICDDLEDSSSVKTKQERNETYNWFMSEVMPAGDEQTRIIALGNLLHMDSFLMRLKKDIEKKTINGLFRAYPLLDDNERILWPAKFSNQRAIKLFQKSVPDEQVWKEEYLLQTTDTAGLPFTIIEEDKDRRKNANGKYPWDREKFPPRRLEPYRISAPLAMSENIIYIARG